MSSSLISNLNSNAQHQTNILTNRPNLVKVMVEDELDVVVWHRILNRCAPHLEFEVQPYSYDTSSNGKGKAQILSLANQFGPYFIGCVDSDFDWLLKNYTADGQTINRSPYILQTYTYSIENLAAMPYGIADCMLECCMHSCDILRNLDADFSDFITSLSKAVYDVTLWHLTMIKENTDIDLLDTGRKHVFGNDHYADILSDRTLSLESKRQALIERLTERASQLADDYNANYNALLQSRSDLEQELHSQCGLTPDNAYLFVRGHNLHDFLIHNFFNPVHTYLKNEHEKEIRAHTVGPDTGNSINHYHKLLKNFDRDYIHRTAFTHDPVNLIAARIKTDIAAII